MKRWVLLKLKVEERWLNEKEVEEWRGGVGEWTSAAKEGGGSGSGGGGGRLVKVELVGLFWLKYWRKMKIERKEKG